MTANVKAPDYKDGLRDGQILALERIAQEHKNRLDNHADRLRTLERVVWALGGIVAFIEFWPKVKDLLGGG